MTIMIFRGKLPFNGTIGSEDKIVEGTHLRLKRTGDTFTCYIEGQKVKLNSLQHFFNGNWFNGIMIGFENDIS